MNLWKELLRLAYVEATKSPDPSTQNGALIVDVVSGLPTQEMRWHKILGGDCNRFPKGVLSTPERWNDRALKYKLVHHAERTTLDTVRRAYHVDNLDGLTLVCPWAACTECAKEIIAAGITTLVTHTQALKRGEEAERIVVRSGKSDRMVWSEDIVVAYRMLREAKVEIIEYDGTVDGPPVRHSGVLWTP